MELWLHSLNINTDAAAHRSRFFFFWWTGIKESDTPSSFSQQSTVIGYSPRGLSQQEHSALLAPLLLHEPLLCLWTLCFAVGLRVITWACRTQTWSMSVCSLSRTDSKQTRLLQTCEILIHRCNIKLLHGKLHSAVIASLSAQGFNIHGVIGGSTHSGSCLPRAHFSRWIRNKLCLEGQHEVNLTPWNWSLSSP